MIRLGLLPDPPDDRDRPFADLRPRLAPLVSATPDAFVIPRQRPPRDQTGNSCVANAWCRALEILSDVAGQSVPDLSAQFLYWAARQRHSGTHDDVGTYLRAGADALTRLGVPAERVWRDSLQTINVQPDPIAFVEGHDARLSAYYRIAEGADFLDEVDSALRAAHPVVTGLLVGTPFIDYRGEGTVLEAPDRPLGGHALVVVGVRGDGDGREWAILNSWGRWGIDGDGLAWISSTYLRTARDTWVGTAAPAIADAA